MEIVSTRAPRKIIAAFATALLLSGCVASGPRYHFGDVPGAVSHAGFQVLPSGSPRHVGSVDDLLQPMFAEALLRKGYVGSGEGAALEVLFEVRVALRQQVLQRPVTTASGTFPRIEYFETRDGAIAVVVRDRKTGNTIYSASVGGEVDPAITTEGLQVVIDGLMARFPEAGPSPASR